MGIRFDLPVVECAVPDTFVSRLIRVEYLEHGSVRLVFGTEQDGIMGREIVIVAKLIWSADAVPELVREISSAAAAHGVLCACMAARTCH